MKTTVVKIPARKQFIAPSSWPKKKLADFHLEALHFCEFGCQYCSSNSGLHLRFRKGTISRAVREATGEDFNPHNATHITIAYRDVVHALECELSQKTELPGPGKTLVYSQLTDGFSPQLLHTDTTRQILELLVKKTRYRIRVLTKNSVVGNREWVRFFAQHKDRFVVGLSIGTLDADFARRMEQLTSLPASRTKALHTLQDAGVPTYGMLCPVLPRVLETDELERLVDEIRPQLCEHVWAEPYNERHNWKNIRACYEEGSESWNWFTRVYEQRDAAAWSRYATNLYLRIRSKAKAGRWSRKLRYLLYEGNITELDARAFRGLQGVLLQCKAHDDGKSKNPHIAKFQ